MQIFDPIACDTANGCQTMSFSHVEKDINRKEHLNLNLEWKSSLTADSSNYNKTS